MPASDHKIFYVYCDGGARGNPGPAAAAAVLYDETMTPIAGSGRYLGCTTNNVAEYEGLLLGLDLARKHKAVELVIRLDSELVVRQVRGEYKVRHPGLKTLWAKTQAQLQIFTRWKIEHVLREQNAAADQLVNETIDRQLPG